MRAQLVFNGLFYRTYVGSNPYKHRPGRTVVHTADHAGGLRQRDGGKPVHDTVIYFYFRPITAIEQKFHQFRRHVPAQLVCGPGKVVACQCSKHDQQFA